MVVAVSMLAHLLVFAYWLGGDLGAFYTSAYMTDAKRAKGERLLALKVLGDLDMAPRTALILALPTGLTLAVAKAWLALSPLMIALLWVAALAWLALAWFVHLRHSGPASLARRLDLLIRWLALAGLIGGGGFIVVTKAAPLFIGLKLMILGGCVLLGLLIRAVMGPLGPAIGVLMGPSGPTTESDAVIREVLSRARPLVVCLWGLLICAALLGAATPV